MDNQELLSDFEDHVDQSFGVRVEHVYDHRRVRRFFAKLSFAVADAIKQPSSLAAIETWPPLDIFRNGYVQREALNALHIQNPDSVSLANLLIPVAVRSNHTGVTQKMFDSVVRDFFLHRHLRRSFTLQRLHEEFATWLAMSLISDRIMIVETDFSHERNMALKYVVRPMDERVMRTPPVPRRANLFFSKEIASALKDGLHVGVHANISGIFNRNIGYADLEGMGDPIKFGPEANAGFLVIAGKRHDYSCAYIMPLYSLINRQSLVIGRMQALFDTFLDILGSEAFYRIERNKHHSKLRHTIGVEVHHLTNNYDEIFQLRPRILEGFEGDTYSLNIQISKVNGLIHDLSRDVIKQFGAEFDIFGNRRSRRGEQADRTLLSPAHLESLVKDVMVRAIEKRKSAPFLIDLDHKAFIDVSADSALTICLTELFNNAIKYNVTGQRIRLRTRDRGEVVIMAISNIGPSLSNQEAELMPLMGLRGMNSQRHSDDGSGQGLATVFGILNDIGVDAEYLQRALTKEQVDRLTLEFGTKAVTDLDLSNHTIELAFPVGTRGGQ